MHIVGMATAAVDELFDWLKKLKASNKEYKEKRNALKAEKKLLEDSIGQLDELMEREVDVSKVVTNAVNSTILEDFIQYASKKGFMPYYGPRNVRVNGIKDLVDKSGISCDIFFKRPAKFEPELIEKTVDYATGCLERGHHICLFSAEQKNEFQKWMLPIRYVLGGPIVRYRDKDDKEQTCDITDGLDKKFLKAVETTLKDSPAERLKEARKAVIASMKTLESFHVNFYLNRDGSLKTFSRDGDADGLRISYPYGHAEPCDVSFLLLKDGEKWQRESDVVLAKAPDICRVLISRIDSYDDMLEKAHKKDGYSFVVEKNVEVDLRFNP